MLFSIIVPVYKTEKYLMECADSILNQSFSDFEVVFVDDGSPDNCPAMIDALADKDPRVKAVHKENGGLVSARKAGMAHCSGDYIVNIDSDDFVGPDFLLKIAKSIETSSPDAVFFGFTLYTEGTEPAPSHRRLNAADTGFYDSNKTKALLSSYLYDSNRPEMNGGCVLFNICCKAVRRSLYIAAQSAVPDEIVSGEDTLFTMNLLPAAGSIDIIDNCDYFYRQNPTSIEHTVTKKDFTNLSAVFSQMEKLMEKHPEYKNPAFVYVLTRVWTLAIRNAKSAPTFKEFKAKVKDPVYESMRKVAENGKVYQQKTTEKVLIFALKKKLYLFIYLLGKTYFKNKDF